MLLQLCFFTNTKVCKLPVKQTAVVLNWSLTVLRSLTLFKLLVLLKLIYNKMNPDSISMGNYFFMLKIRIRLQ